MKNSPVFCAAFVERAAIVESDAFADVELRIGEMPELFERRVGCAEHRRDHHARHSGTEVIDEVEPTRPDLFVEQLLGRRRGRGPRRS